MTRTYCEAVVEGMGSVLNSRLESRGKLGIEKLSEETFVSWNSSSSASAPREFLVYSLERRFGKDRAAWHFTTKTKQKSLLKVKTTSKVVDKVRSEVGRIRWGDRKEN